MIGADKLSFISCTLECVCMCVSVYVCVYVCAGVLATIVVSHTVTVVWQDIMSIRPQVSSSPPSQQYN